jgi:DNA-binding transcriptional LysR family regulator
MHICMSRRTIHFDWNRARAFLATAEEGSFSAAARALGVAQPTLGRQVAALERELDVTLFERVGRGLQMTSTGQDLLEDVRVMAEAANRISLTAAGQSLSLDGQICIAASEIVAVHILPAIIGKIRALHPGIEIEVVASNQASDLQRREADIAIRSFRPTQPELVARKIRDDCARLYATPAYLETLGQPVDADTLSRAEFVGFDHGDALTNGLNALGLDLSAENFPLVTANQFVQWELVKRGLCVGIMMEEVGDAEPAVTRALPSLPPFPLPIWLVSHRELKTSRRVRVVFELLAEGLG